MYIRRTRGVEGIHRCRGLGDIAVLEEGFCLVRVSGIDGKGFGMRR